MSLLPHLVQIMTPELIIQVIKANPKLIVETLQKFDTFKLLGQSLSEEQQVILSNNLAKVNGFLLTPDGKSAIGLWMEEFTQFLNKTKDTIKAETPAEMEARIRSELLTELNNK